MKRGLMSVVGVVLSSVSCLHGSVIKQADQVFKRWVDRDSAYVHNEFVDVNPAEMASYLDNQYVERVGQKIAQNTAAVAPFMPLLSMPHNVPPTHVGSFSFKLTNPLKQSLEHGYRCLSEPSKIPGFLKLLKRRGLSSTVLDGQEQAAEFHSVIDKYTTFMEILFSQEHDLEQQRYLLAVANRFFEFCFSPATWNEFKTIIGTQEHYPLGRLLYTTMWYNLASIGWKEWHASCLDALKKEADKGKQIVYIAGGCDLYAMIKKGIYNICVIDPMLPTQPRYYIPDWLWFVQGQGAKRGMGDQLIFKFPHHNITMKRSYYQEYPEYFTVKLSDSRDERIKKSITRWTLHDDHGVIGTITFERRLCTQQDFQLNQNKAMLMSFNELYYITNADQHENWGIKPAECADDFSMYIKQLRNPVTRPMMCYMNEADASAFQFIKLGTCVN